MKARIKSTGEIVEVEQTGHGIFHDDFGNMYMWDAIDFQSESEQPILETHINWEARRYELAKAAMQGMLSNPTYDVFDNGFSNANTQLIVSLSIGYADEAVKQLKGGQG